MTLVQMTMVDEDVRHGRLEKHKLENQKTHHPVPNFADGYWILPMDAFPTIKKVWYVQSKATFQLTAKYLVCFLKDDPSKYMLDNRVRENADHIPGPRTVNKDHPVFWGNVDNFARYEKIIDTQIFRGRGENGFVTHAMGAIDLSIRDLHELPDTDNMFAFHKSRPRTRDDVMRLLFKDGSPGMVAMQNQAHGEAIAQVLKYASAITRQGANPKRFVEGIHAWRDKMGFRFKLGETTISKRRMELHGLVSIARRMSCNNYWTAVSAKMASKWKLKLVRDRKQDKMEDGEFLVDVGPYLPEQLKKVFREKQVVTFVTEEGATRNLEREAEACLAGLTSDMRRSGMTKDQLDQIYQRVSKSTYTDGPDNAQNKTPTKKKRKTTTTRSPTRMSPRKNSAAQTVELAAKKRKAKKSITDETNTDAVTREGGGAERLTGILTKKEAVRDKVTTAPGLVLSVWCCKHAFSVESECTLAYCMSCKEQISSCGKKEDRRGRRRSSRTSCDQGKGRVGTDVVCCAKGKCMKHTEADWEDLVEQFVENSYLKKTRQNNKEMGWEDVAENCWGCGKMF